MIKKNSVDKKTLNDSGILLTSLEDTVDSTTDPKLDKTESNSVNIDNTIKEKNKKTKKPFRFPWWFIIIGYILSYAIIGVSAFFIIAKGIEFGNDSVTKWLSSLVISVLASIFLTSPFKAFLTALFFVILFRKDKEDPLDEEQSNFSKLELTKKLHEKNQYEVCLKNIN